MNKISLISAITLLLGLQSSPILLHAQVVQTTADYHPFYLDAVKYDSTTGVIAVNPDYDATDKVVIKNDSVSLSTLSYHYIHFWDDAGTYLGHYATSGAKECVNACIGTISTSDIPLPLGSYSYAVERFDRDDADYEVTTGVTLSDLFDQPSTYNLVGDSGFDYNILNNFDLVDSFDNNTILLSTLSINPDFDNGTNQWNNLTTTNFIVINGIAYFTATARYGRIYQNINLVATNKYLLVSSVKTTANMILGNVYNNGPTFSSFITTNYHTGSSSFEILQGIGDSTQIANAMRIMDERTTGWDEIAVDFIYLFDLTTMFGDGNEPNTINDFYSWVTTNTTKTNITTTEYYKTITFNDLDNIWSDYYSLWSNNVVAGLETIDQQYYLNGDRKEIYDLTTIFGAGSEPNLATMQGYYTDYDTLFDYSYISPLAWAVAPTYTVTYWDDQVEDAISGGFMLAASIAVTFILMMIGFTKRAKLFNLFAIAGAVWFTIQAGASLPIIIVGFGLIVINALYFAKEGD